MLMTMSPPLKAMMNSRTDGTVITEAVGLPHCCLQSCANGPSHMLPAGR